VRIKTEKGRKRESARALSLFLTFFSRNLPFSKRSEGGDESGGFYPKKKTQAYAFCETGISKGTHCHQQSM
jgi:hypothetical protein